MGQLRGLIDTNVLVAMVAPDHIHHEPSLALASLIPSLNLAISVHSLSEFFNITTRPLPRGLGLTAFLAHKIIESFTNEFSVVGLSPTQHVAALRDFALTGRTGPVIYDFLIGQVAVLQDIPKIITWNIKHMTPLFPSLTVTTPSQFTKET